MLDLSGSDVTDAFLRDVAKPDLVILYLNNTILPNLGTFFFGFPHLPISPPAEMRTCLFAKPISDKYLIGCSLESYESRLSRQRCIAGPEPGR